MQLERIVVGMRPRTSWEAMDLGFALVRHAARDIYAAVLVLMVPIAGVAIAVAAWLEPWAGVFVIWWLKPVTDAIVLSVLARSLIGERTRVRATFREAPRALQKHLLGALTFRRLSPSRTFTMPVRHLEGLSRKGARDRIVTLATGRRGAAQLACAVCLGLDYAMWLAGIQTIAMFATSNSVTATSILPGNLPTAAFIAIVALSASIVEPVFAAIGFALYINRRVELEGWDLELAFRALRTRAARKSAGKVATLVAAVAVLILPLAAGAQVTDASPPADPVLVGPPTSPAKAIKDVLADPEFVPWRLDEQWQAVETPDEDELEISQTSDRSVSFENIGAIIAKVLPWLFGLLGGVLVIHLGMLALRSQAIVAAAEGVAGDRDLTVVTPRQRALAGDIPGLARAAWARGEHALALSILYRGSITYLTQAGVDFPEGATEQECVSLSRSKNLAPALVDSFSAIARTWQRCAYAHRLPTHGDFESLAAGYASAFVTDVAQPERDVA